MDQKNSQLRHSAKYGLITGGIIVLFQLMLYIFGMLNNQKLNNITFFIIVIGLFISVKHFRDRINGGLLNFGKAFGVGILTCLFMGIAVAVYTYFQYKFFSPHLMEQLLLETEDRLARWNFSDEILEQQINMMHQIVTPLFVSFSSVLGTVIWGALLSLLTALLLKRDENPLLIK
ncbi:MAG: DUF4199 domain-containing protein [Bacteroidales bacterium]|nr:DUF4199 domain-containing protein [Bacteroidales bacterium]